MCLTSSPRLSFFGARALFGALASAPCLCVQREGYLTCGTRAATLAATATSSLLRGRLTLCAGVCVSVCAMVSFQDNRHTNELPAPPPPPLLLLPQLLLRLSDFPCYCNLAVGFANVVVIVFMLFFCRLMLLVLFCFVFFLSRCLLLLKLYLTHFKSVCVNRF